MSLSLVMPSPYSNVLYIGPDHRNHRGGIGAVLSIYSKNIEPFNFIPTLSYKNKFYELFFFSGALLRLFLQLLTNRRISIVHIHGAKDGSIMRKFVMSFVAKKIFGKKIIFHIHAGAFNECYERGGRFYKYMCRFLVNHSEALVVLSEIWNDFFRQHFRVKRLLVIKNPVEHKQPVCIKAIHQPGIVTFLFLGRIADHKGIFDLVNLITAEQHTLRGKCKFIVGGNHEVDRLLKAIEEGGIGDIVEYVGWVQDAEKDRFFSLCDYFILPTYEEAMPMTILEAFSYGKPVISTPVGSIPEVVKDRQNGYLFTPGDMTTLKKIIFHATLDRAGYEYMKANAMNTAIEFYPESIKTELEKLYAEIV
ncbi:MAG: glycosyltransferase family 4 protein [Chitinophagaceae bacterium]|nr:glycosyltransferase family 4 protein [Chitinophagaceae bacterium]